MKWNWGVSIVVAYAVFAAGTLGFVAFAMTQPVDLVSADYYARSMRHDERLRAESRVDALGAAFSCAIEADGRSVLLTLPREHRTLASGTVVVYRPSDAGADRTVPIVLDHEGRQRVPLPGAGRWILKVEWTVRETSYYHEQPMVAR